MWFKCSNDDAVTVGVTLSVVRAHCALTTTPTGPDQIDAGNTGASNGAGSLAFTVLAAALALGLVGGSGQQ